MLTKPSRKLVRYACGTVALALVAVTCKDLTGPTGIATDGTSTVAITYMGPKDANGVLQLVAGNKISPPVRVTIGGVVATRAQYVFSVGDTSVLRVSAHGDSVFAVGRGRDTITVTLMGATIGGQFDTLRIKPTDRVPVAVRPERNVVTTQPIPTLRSFDETTIVGAESQGSDLKRVRPGKVRWYSTSPAIFTVDSLGALKPDSSSTSTVKAVGNGTSDLLTVFDDIDTLRTPVTVQQQLAKYLIGSKFPSPGGTAISQVTAIDFKSLGDTTTLIPSPRDANNFPLVAGAVPPPSPTFSIAPLGRVSLSAAGLLTANTNTVLGSPSIVTVSGSTPSGTVTSDPLPVTVQQVAASITIIGKRIDTIPSIGSTKDLIAVVKDSLGNDIQAGITWTSRNTTVVQYRTSTSGDFALAIDTGTTQMVVSRDQVSDSIRITVTNDPATVILQPDTIFIRSVNDIGRFASITVRNAKGDILLNIPITWSSADPTIVQARADSSMRAVAVGATNVTARTPNGKTAIGRVIVTNAPAFLDILPNNSTLGSVGDTILNIAVDFRNGLGVALPRSSASWSSTDVNIATVNVDPSGNVRIIAAATGNAYIRAVSPVDPLVRDSVFVTVTNAPVSIVAAPSPAPTLNAFGATINFTATVLNAKGDPIPTSKVRWSVPTGGAFVAIDSITGVATALANGSAIVRATSSGITTDVPVTVAQAIAGTRSLITPGAASLVANGAQSTSITVQLRDANDNNIAFGGSSVVLSTSLGTLAPLPPTDVGNGRYTTTLLTGTTTGSASITGTANGSAITNNGLVAFTAGPANKYIVTPNNFTPAAGGSVTVRAQLADVNNNPITTAGTVAQFTSTNGGAFTPVNGQATTDVAGVATITFTTSASVSSHTITATTGAITGSSAAITSVAGTATKYIVMPATTTPAAGTVVRVFAQLADANNNVVAQAGQTASWSHTGTGSSFSGSATASSVTNSSGVAVIDFTTNPAAGETATVIATTGAVTGTSPTITSTAGSGSQLSVTQAPTPNPQSGVAFPTQPTIQLRDAVGNVVNQPNISVTAFITSGGGTLSGLTTVQTNASGLATFLDLAISGAVGPRTLTFIANTFSATNAGVTLIAGPPSTSTTTITASPTSMPADNVSQSVVDVQVRDAAGNPLGTGLTVNLATTLGSLSANPAADIGGGLYRATLTAGAISGNATITGTVGGSAIVDNAVVTLTPLYPVPTLSSIAPTSGARLGTLNVVFTGTNYIAGVSSVNADPGITVNSTTVDSPTQITASLTIAATAPTGIHSLSVTNSGPGGGTSSSQNFTVNNPLPTLTSIAPTSGDRLQTLDVVFTGSGFINGVSSVSVGAGITINSATVDSPSQITANVTISVAASTGARNFSVTNTGPGGGTSGNQSFTVTNPLPSLTSVSPTAAVQGEAVTVVLTGTGFVSGASVDFSPNTDITINSTTVNSPTQITLSVSIASTAATGSRTVTVTNAGPGGGTSGAQSFDINAPPAPTLTGIAPAAGDRLQTLDVVFTGTGFANGVSAVDVPAGITVNSTTVNSPTQITANITITAAASLGANAFSVTNTPTGGTSAAQTFTVSNPQPTITNVNPNDVNVGLGGATVASTTITGTGFVVGETVVDFVEGDVNIAGTVTVISPTQIIVTNIQYPGVLLLSQTRNIRVTNTGQPVATSAITIR